MPKITAPRAYVHTQSVPSDVWTIVHNLDTQPSVSVQIYLETQSQDPEVPDTMVLHTIIPADISYPDLNTVEISFSDAFTGTARLV